MEYINQDTKTTEVQKDEFTQSEFTAEISISTEAQETATEIPKAANEATGAETAVSSIPQETGIIEASAYSEVTEYTEATVAAPAQSNSTNNAMGFLLLAGVFGAVIAAAIFFMKNKKKSADVDISALSAKDRDEIRLNKQKRKKPKKKKIKKKRIVAKTVQKTLPYKRICDNYLMNVDENKYSKTYRFEDINYSIAKQEEQEGIFLGYCSVLNSFDTNADIQITVHNNRVNKADFNKMVLLKHKGNDFDRYIDVYNDMLVEKWSRGRTALSAINI